MTDAIELKLELDITKICRICLLQSKKFLNIYSNCIVDGYILSIPDMLKSCLDLEVCLISLRCFFIFYLFKQNLLNF